MSKFKQVQIRSRGEGHATTSSIDAAVKILGEQHPMTARQLFHRLIGAGMVKNTKREYARVSRLMAIARKDWQASAARQHRSIDRLRQPNGEPTEDCQGGLMSSIWIPASTGFTVPVPIRARPPRKKTATK